MIATENELQAVLPSIAAAPWIALDTEADSLHSYPEKLCLIQLSFPGQDILVDPLAGVNLAPLFTALSGREILLHGSDYDLRLLRRTFNFIPTAIFDTMLAARLLGIEEFGLTHLVSRFLGIALSKSSQRANWSQRPLTEKMYTYAQEDSRHLHALSSKLRAELEAVGRLDWHKETCDALIRDATAPPIEDPDGDWRLKGVERLSRRGQAVARELWHWREAEATALNRPPFFLLAHDTLLDLADAATSDRPVEPLIPKRYPPHRKHSIRKAIEAGLQIPVDEWPMPRRHRGRPLTMRQKEELERLRVHRDAEATRLGLNPSLVASKATLTQLAKDWEGSQELLLNWQRSILAAAKPAPASTP